MKYGLFKQSKKKVLYNDLISVWFIKWPVKVCYAFLYLKSTYPQKLLFWIVRWSINGLIITENDLTNKIAELHIVYFFVYYNLYIWYVYICSYPDQQPKKYATTFFSGTPRTVFPSSKMWATVWIQTSAMPKPKSYSYSISRIHKPYVENGLNLKSWTMWPIPKS